MYPSRVSQKCQYLSRPSMYPTLLLTAMVTLLNFVLIILFCLKGRDSIPKEHIFCLLLDFISYFLSYYMYSEPFYFASYVLENLSILMKITVILSLSLPKSIFYDFTGRIYPLNVWWIWVGFFLFVSVMNSWATGILVYMPVFFWGLF